MGTFTGYAGLARRRVLFLDNEGHCVYPFGIAVVPPTQLEEFKAATSNLLKAGKTGGGKEDPFLAYYSCPIPVRYGEKFYAGHSSIFVPLKSTEHDRHMTDPVTIDAPEGSLRPMSGKKRLQEQQQQQHRADISSAPYLPPQPQGNAADLPTVNGGRPTDHVVDEPRKPAALGGLVDLLNSDSDVSLPPSDVEEIALTGQNSAQDILQGLAFWLNPQLWMVTFDVPDRNDLAPDSQWHQLDENAQLEHFVTSAMGQALFDPCNNSASGTPSCARRVFMCRMSDNGVLNAASELANHYHFPGTTLPAFGSLLANARNVLLGNALHNAFSAGGGKAPGNRSVQCCDGRVEREAVEGSASVASSSSNAGAQTTAGSSKVAIFCPCRSYHATKGGNGTHGGGCAAYGASYLFHFLKDEFLMIEWKGVSRTTPGPDAPAPSSKPPSPSPAVHAMAGSSGTWQTASPLIGKLLVAAAATRRAAASPQLRSRQPTGDVPTAPASRSASVRKPGTKSRGHGHGGDGGSAGVQKRKHVRRASAPRASAASSVCDECGATESCVWRQDRANPARRLCNACGLRVSRYQRKIWRLDAMIAASATDASAAASAAAAGADGQVRG